MNILFASAEVFPFAQTGGLGDVAGSLPKFIKKKGLDVRIIMPFYGCINEENFEITDLKISKTIGFGDKKIKVSLCETTLPESDIKVYLVKNARYFQKPKEIYAQGTYENFEKERFIIYNKAVLELTKELGFMPDLIHCNDWHTGFIPVYLKTTYKKDLFFKNTKTLFSIHNLAYQGQCTPEILEFAKIPKSEFKPKKMKHNDSVNFMKSGIVYADKINTVSPNYAKEILKVRTSHGLSEVLNEHKKKLTGILNGIDYGIWDPEIDNAIPCTYSTKRILDKSFCKSSLQQELRLEQLDKKPLISMVTRLTEQKGVDLFYYIANDLRKVDAQFVILGTGDKKFEEFFAKLDESSTNIRYINKFDINLAKKIYAASDMFLMPSKFEPCGIGQLIALKYGAIPIVRKTGGLADTVFDYEKSETPNGFVFEKYNSEELLAKIKQASRVYSTGFLANYKNNKISFRTMVKKAMKLDFSWDKSAEKYIDIYNELCN